MDRRKYYSIRTGKSSDRVLYDLHTLLGIFLNFYVDFLDKDYFDELYKIPNIEAEIFRAIKKNNLWIIQEKYINYSEEDLFDVIEFLYDHVSKPIDNYLNNFDKKAGQQEFRDRLNQVLSDYKGGYELSEFGEILELPDEGLDSLLAEDLPIHDPINVEQRVKFAILKFRRYHSSSEDKLDAVRDLVDVLEYLRPQFKGLISSNDENDLFNIANNFAIRHHNKSQKTDYDKSIWYNWMFYSFLATIHTFLKLVKR